MGMDKNTVEQILGKPKSINTTVLQGKTVEQWTYENENVYFDNNNVFVWQKPDAEKSKSNVIEAYEYLGYYSMLQKDYANAKCMYIKLKDLDPNNAKAKKALAEPSVSKANCAQ
jgi:hypothetical protein